MRQDSTEITVYLVDERKSKAKKKDCAYHRKPWLPPYHGKRWLHPYHHRCWLPRQLYRRPSSVSVLQTAEKPTSLRRTLSAAHFPVQGEQVTLKNKSTEQLTVRGGVDKVTIPHPTVYQWYLLPKCFAAAANHLCNYGKSSVRVICTKTCS